MKACPQCQFRYPAEAIYCFVDGAELRAIVDPLLGATLAGRYVVDDALGEGGMATVYRARFKVIDRPCAIKIMSPTFARDEKVRERFRREAKSARALSHPNVIEIFDQGELEDGTPYIVMELLEGQTLSALVDQAPLDLGRGISIMIQIARAMARAHDLGVVHRDLKPDNIFICRRLDGGDLVKVLDFGIARSQNDPRLTSAGELFGTPQYMAPERIIHGESGPSVDLYAAGVIFFEMATSKVPFDAQDASTCMAKHIQETPVAPRVHNPSIPEALDALIVTLLEKDPRDRPVDARRVEKDLEAIARAIGARIPPEPEVDPESSGPLARPPLRLTPDIWLQRVDLFAEMLARAYGGHSPADPERTLAELRHLVREFEEIRAASSQEQRSLEELDAKGRDGRQRFGFAVDATGLDASTAKDDVRAAREAAEHAAARAEAMAVLYRDAVAELLTWEGRAAGREPTAHLAEAYRGCADAVDRWLEAQREHVETQRQVTLRERTVDDLTFQIGALREALVNHEQSVDREREAAKKRAVDLNERGERVESRLLQLAAQFCAPLRSRPDLGELFSSLESSRAPNPFS